MSKFEKKDQLGFGLIETRQTYNPLLLDCLITGKCNREYLNQVPSESKVNLNDVQHVKLWVMSGRHWLYGKRFFFRTENSSSLFFEKSGNLRIVFDAKQFFAMYLDASKENSRNFFENAIVLNQEEILKFREMVKANRHLLSARKIARANAWIELLN